MDAVPAPVAYAGRPGWGAIGALQSLAWALGWPVRTVLLLAIGGYRVTVGRLVGGNCRFHPSCSAYAMEAIRSLGAVRGTALAAWRILRCSPLSRGGVDYPPASRLGLYDRTIRRGEVV